MKTNLCKHLRNLSEAEESSQSISCIDDAWSFLMKMIKNKSMLSESEKEHLEALDQILKWELLGFEKSEFNWNTVNWPEIKAAVLKCNNNLCK